MNDLDRFNNGQLSPPPPRAERDAIAAQLFCAYMTMPVAMPPTIQGGEVRINFMRPDQASKLAITAADAFVAEIAAGSR